MRLGIYVAMASLVAFVTAHFWFFFACPPGSTVESTYVLEQIRADKGAAWIVELPVAVASDKGGVGNSSVRLFEDGIELGPAHSMHRAVRQQGRGAFTHRGNRVVFSTSDGSDPIRNAKTYTAAVPVPVAAWPRVLLVAFDYLLASAIGSWLLTRMFRVRARPRPWMFIALQIFLTSALAITAVEGICGVLLAHRRAVVGAATTALADAVLGDGSDHSFHGKSVQYSEHHYLNYILNPDFRGGVARQFERRYRIRRTQPLLSRDASSWRVLVLGGSTTYGQGLDAEEDTWVYQLESRLRTEHGSDVELINCGVGGYTLLENIIHYITLLSRLEPDMVILLTGINDVHPRLFGDLRSDYSNYRKPWRSDGWVLPPPIAALHWSQAYRLFYFTTHVESVQRRGIGGLASYDYPDSSTWAESLGRNGPGYYRDHLRTFVQMLKAQGRKVALLPQHYVATKDGGEFFAIGVREHNDAAANVAAELEVPYAAELLNGLRPGDVFDHCHFGVVGSQRMADLVVAFLRQNGITPP